MLYIDLLRRSIGLRPRDPDAWRPTLLGHCAADTSASSSNILEVADQLTLRRSSPGWQRTKGSGTVAALGSLLFIIAWLPAQGALDPAQIKALPPPADRPVSFRQEIKPIFESSCIKCHGRGRSKGGFKLDTRETILKGGDSGPAVVLGKSARSYLIELVSGLNADLVMPQKGSKLTPTQVGLLRAWIDQGLPWEEGVSFARPEAANLVPRQPELPAKPDGSPSDNPVDRFLWAYYKAHHFSPPQVVADRLFARRAYLDVIGLLPSSQDLTDFLSDSRSDKRERLVQRLLENNQPYAVNWLTFWNDALRNDYQGTGYIDGGRKQITPWLYAALARNLPYDKFVARLVNPTTECEGFINGIVWRGVVNASQTPQMQAAQSISQVFMGANLKCASCHDSFINDWTLADAYGMACIYSPGPLEMVHCDKPTGQMASVKFLYPELGTIDRALDQGQCRQRLAEIMTEKQNGRLTRTIVNRLWARFLGRGLVEPVDDMDNPAWNQDLLDWLAADLADHSYDLKHTIALILTSQAYQLPTADVDEMASKDFVFHGPLVRRMDAEQYLDAVSSLTGVWQALPANLDIDFTAAPDQPAGSLPRDLAARAKWIGGQSATTTANTPSPALYLRKTITLTDMPSDAVVVCQCDYPFKLYVDGKEVASGNDTRKPKLVRCHGRFGRGENVIAVAVTAKSSSSDTNSAEPPRAAFRLYARLLNEPAASEFVTDASWLASTSYAADWEKTDFTPTDWTAATELAGLDADPNQSNWAWGPLVSVAGQYDHVRAALVSNNPLMAELGRPNREQTVTRRSEAATTLQALELTNGSTLAGILRQGAELLAEKPASGRDLVERLYRQALDRPPTDGELALATRLLGDPIQREGIEDLLWGIIMLPEFQLIY